MSVKRQSTDVINFKRGSSQINFIYRGTTLIWQKSSPSQNYIVNIFNTTFTSNTLLSTNGTYSTIFNLLDEKK